jgi:hypothetical protein
MTSSGVFGLSGDVSVIGRGFAPFGVQNSTNSGNCLRYSLSIFGGFFLRTFSPLSVILKYPLFVDSKRSAFFVFV